VLVIFTSSPLITKKAVLTPGEIHRGTLGNNLKPANLLIDLLFELTYNQPVSIKYSPIEAALSSKVEAA
jgi:hypothetical protein